MYIVARMILGFGIPFCIISGSAMLGELGYPKERPFLTALFNSSYFIGSLTAAAITMGTNHSECSPHHANQDARGGRGRSASRSSLAAAGSHVESTILTQ